jgi:hypothetical protein
MLSTNTITNMIWDIPIYFAVRSLDYFYKLFLINSLERTAVPLCPFVKSGAMHSAFQKYLRADRMGIDYDRLRDFDTRGAIEGIYAGQRPAGERMLQDGIRARRKDQLDEAITNAVRIGIDRSNPKLFQQAKTLRQKL